LIDGERSIAEDIINFNQEEIESIGIFRGDSIIKIYGKEASNGLIIVKSKK